MMKKGMTSELKIFKYYFVWKFFIENELDIERNE
jgi:hypothetical protein